MNKMVVGEALCMFNVTLRDELLLDFVNELNRMECGLIKGKSQEDDSYQFMITNLETRLSKKRKNDKSVTKKDIAFIKTVLNNTRNSLREAYGRIIWFLEDQKCVMPQKERGEYFLKRLNKHPCTYLMEAIDLLVEATKKDYMDVTASLGMCNSEALDFLSAYGDEDGWVEEKDD